MVLCNFGTGGAEVAQGAFPRLTSAPAVPKLSKERFPPDFGTGGAEVTQGAFPRPTSAPAVPKLTKEHSPSDFGTGGAEVNAFRLCFGRRFFVSC